MRDDIKVHVVDYGRKSLYMRCRDPQTGKQVTRSTGTNRKREAERAAAKWEADLQEGRYKAPSKVTWLEFRRRYESEVVPSLAAKTGDKVAAMFNAVERIVCPKLLASVDSERISKWQAQLRLDGLAESSVKGHTAYLKAALRWANRHGLLNAVPTIEMPKRAATMKGRPITTEEFERMLSKVPDVLQCDDAAESWQHLLWGLWWSGLRLGEALNLHWIDDRRLCVDFTGKRPMFRIRAMAHKSRKDCILPLAPEFAEFLLQTPEVERDGYVLNPASRRAGSGRLKLDAVSRVICRIGKAAGVKVAENAAGRVKYASAHDLRRAFGFRWAMRVMPPTLMLLMRHASVQTTQEFYVGRDAESAAEVLWEAISAPGNSLGNTCGNSDVGTFSEMTQTLSSQRV